MFENNFKINYTMKKFTLVACLMLLGVIAFAQKPVRFGVYLGEATPFGAMGQGDAIKKTPEHIYGDLTHYAMLSEKGDQGYASIGANVGFDVTVALPVEGLGVFGGIDFFINSNKNDVRDCFEDWSHEIVKQENVSSAEFNLPNVMNIPILFGLNYLHNFNNIVGVWGEAGIGPNFRLISDFKFETKYTALVVTPEGDYDVTTETYDYDAATTLGFKLGAGVMLWNKMSIGLDYYSLGSSKINANYKVKAGDRVIIEDKFKGENDIYTGELVVRVGYHF